MILLIFLGVYLASIVLASIYVAYQLKRAIDMPDDEAESREEQERQDFTYTVHVPIPGTFHEGKELTPWSMLENMKFEEEEEQE